MSGCVEIGDRVRFTIEGIYDGAAGAIPVGTTTGDERDSEFGSTPDDTVTVELVEKAKIESRDGLSLGDRIKHRLGGEGVIVEFHDLGTNGDGDMKVAWETGVTAGRTVGTLQKNVEKIEPPKPKPKFKVGDRVRHEGGKIGRVVNVYPSVAKPGEFVCAVEFRLGTFGHYEDELTLVPDQTFKLRPGDKIRNTKTGRVGTVLDNGYVYDINVPALASVLARIPVAAIEEYEEHRPGTYEIIERGDRGPF